MLLPFTCAPTLSWIDQQDHHWRRVKGLRQHGTQVNETTADRANDYRNDLDDRPSPQPIQCIHEPSASRSRVAFLSCFGRESKMPVSTPRTRFRFVFAPTPLRKPLRQRELGLGRLLHSISACCTTRK